MRRTWTIHCHQNRCYWECVTELLGDTTPHVIRSFNFNSWTEATLDAQRHGLDPDDPDQMIVRKNYHS